MHGAAETARRGVSPSLVESVVRGIDRVLLVVWQIIGTLATAVLFVAILSAVLLRYLSDQGAGWVNEIPFLIFPWLVASGFTLAALTGSHIVTEAVTGALPLRVSRPLAIVTHSAAAALFAYLSWQGKTLLMITMSEHYPILGLPTAYAYAALVAATIVLTITEIGAALLVAFGTADPRDIRSIDPSLEGH